MSLSDIELRVLGALLEKERTTPEHYPLSTNALVLACNQKTSRDPVSDYSRREVEDTLRLLADKGLTASTQGAFERAVKHRHRLAETFDLGAGELALLAVLMLRGPQTPGELRSRTERYLHFADTAAVEAGLQRLLEHRPPLVKNLGRGPGQSQDRWQHTLGVDPERLKPRARQPEATSEISSVASAAASSGGVVTDSSAARDELAEDLAALRAEVAQLRDQVARLLEHVGLSERES